VALASGTSGAAPRAPLGGSRPGDEVLCSTSPSLRPPTPSSTRVACRSLWIVTAQPGTWIPLSYPAPCVSGRRRTGSQALVVVHLYGQSADMDPIRDACAEYGVVVIETPPKRLARSTREAAGPSATSGLLLQRKQDHHHHRGGMLVSSNPTGSPRPASFPSRPAIPVSLTNTPTRIQLPV